MKRGGLIEKAFGLTLRELLYDFGGGSHSGRPIRAVQAGGPLGAYIPPHVDHGATCTEAGVLLDIFNPVREDFLEG